LGSTNKYNVVHATVDALRALRDPQGVASSRSKQVEEVAADYPVAAVSAKAAVASSIVASTEAAPGAGS
jgi:hypothetical protein